MSEMDIPGLLAELTLEEKAALPRRRTSGTPRRSSGWASRRSWSPTARTGCASSRTRATTSASASSVPATCFPTAVGAGLDAGTPSWCAASARRSARGARAGRRGRARPGHQHQALAAVRAQLRVLLRGPAARRRARCRARRGHAEPGRRRVAEALRRQQPGDRPDAGQRRGRRAHAARDLPARVRAGGDPGAAVDGDVRLQPGQRRLRVAAPLAAHRGAARRVGLRRPGRLRLGRGRTTGSPALAAGLDLRDAADLGAQRRARSSRRCAPAGWTRRSSTRAVAPGARRSSSGAPARRPRPRSTSTRTTRWPATRRARSAPCC